jgi:lipopolysaccharide/colanic/teichoic acid biosynthesis glycosyltransferase
LIKRLFDITGSIFGILLFFPVMIVIAILIKCTSKGPIFFTQSRIGLNGKNFKMLKFRTMFINSEKKGTGLYVFENDTRITKLGFFIRRISFDELPQLFNVLIGSMSLVGPRPPVTYELGDWSGFTPTMKKRFKVKPGITGFAQISGRNSLEWDRKIAYDLFYIREFKRIGIIFDIYIIIKSFKVVISGKDILENKKKEVMNANKNIAKRAAKSNQENLNE